MELHQVQAAFPDCSNHQVFCRVDEDAHFHDERRQLADKASGSFDRDGAGTLVIEYEAQQIGARFGCRHPVREIRDAADFDFHWHIGYTSLASYRIGDNPAVARTRSASPWGSSGNALRNAAFRRQGHAKYYRCRLKAAFLRLKTICT